MCDELDELPRVWCHGDFRPATVLLATSGSRHVRVCGGERGEGRPRAYDLYHVLARDADDPAAIAAAFAELPAALAAYVRHSWPLRPDECRLLPAVLWLRAAETLGWATDRLAPPPPPARGGGAARAPAPALDPHLSLIHI